MKKVLINFIRDQLIFSVLYFLSNVLVIVFYYIVTGGNTEIFYPVFISVFIFIIFIVIKWFPYYKFNFKLSNIIENKGYELTPTTAEQKGCALAIDDIHSYYLNNIESIKQANTNKNRFISQWIHNMKTPISVIDLILQKEELSKDDKNNLKEENEKLLTHLEQVLILMRLDDFSKDYVPKACDLTESLKRVINNKKNQFIYNNVFPKLLFDKEFVVLTDSKWNEIMLEQFVSNAIKYSANSNAAKKVYFDITRDNGRVQLKITDEGMGIEKSDLSRVFEPFFTGENGRKLKNSSGIGLFICAEISKMLGHKIEIESEVFKGTVVTVTYLSKV